MDPKALKKVLRANRPDNAWAWELRELRDGLTSPCSARSRSQETVEVLSDSDALAALEAGLAELERGETVTLAELRSELAERRPTASG